MCEWNSTPGVDIFRLVPSWKFLRPCSVNPYEEWIGWNLFHTYYDVELFFLNPFQYSSIPSKQTWPESVSSRRMLGAAWVGPTCCYGLRSPAVRRRKVVLYVRLGRVTWHEARAVQQRKCTFSSTAQLTYSNLGPAMTHYGLLNQASTNRNSPRFLNSLRVLHQKTYYSYCMHKTKPASASHVAVRPNSQSNQPHHHMHMQCDKWLDR